MKKFIAIVLALVLCMSLCAFASAATTDARSDTKTVTVKTYALAITVGDDLLLWDETGAASSTISVTNGIGDRSVTTKVLLQVGGKTVKEINGTTVTAADIRAAAGTTEEVVKVTIVTSESTVTKNGVVAKPTEATAAEVIVMNNIPGSDVNPTDQNGSATTGLLVATITVDVSEAFPGDLIKITGKTDVSALQEKLGSTATVTATSTTIYVFNGTGSGTILKTEAGASVSAEDYAEDVASMQYWVIGTASITEG